ncbi:MAG: hypothetical protein KF803_10495 [Cyclobacteriaceae bacterium]|nr:hypothetical protein [Cyclobacteriaceae bacterium]
MKLKGGVIIIGSLIWEDHLDNKKADNIRKNWRNQNLIDKPILTKVPIRYGRESQTRKDTYTMIFSKSCEDNLGQGLILPFNQDVITFEGLERQAVALAIAEGIYKNDNLRLTSSWGSVGLLINPKLKETDFASKELIQKKWSDIYHSYSDTFIADSYKTNNEISSPITQDGFLNITWQTEMDAFDLLVATPVIPKPKALLNADDIAQRMIDKDYRTYFENNKMHNIATAADQAIKLKLDNAEKESISK